MSLYYADTSAVVKLFAEETHSRALADFYDSQPNAQWVSSTLLEIELIRTVRRAAPVLLTDAKDLLLAFAYIAIGDDIVDAAMDEPDQALRSRDAIHLATARVLATDLDGFVSYDDRLLAAVSGAGLVGLSPRDEPSGPQA